MAASPELRRVNREIFNSPAIALISFQTETDRRADLFVGVQNYSVHGVLIKSEKDFNKEFELKVMVRNPELRQWDSFFCRVAWRQKDELQNMFNIGLEFLSPVDTVQDNDKKVHNGLSPQDLEFILNARLLNTLSKKDICHFLNCMEQVALKKGCRFIKQGDKGDSLYLIQKGLCSVQIQKEGTAIQTTAQRREGDVVGEMALLTGEPRAAGVICESDMILWKLPCKAFDQACIHQPKMREFLTALLINRLENSTITEVRNVGSYIMTHPVGHGVHSFVYRGRHRHLNLPVAIKMMKHSQAMDMDFLNDFRHAGKRIAKLNHSNIVQVYDIEEAYRTIFIIMECLEGESLEELLHRKGGLPFSRALGLLIQIGSGLAYAHDKQIFHRNIRPEKVFVLKDDRVKLLGFGPACSPERMNTEGPAGDVSYMPPEQIDGGPVDRHSDIYSFGIMVYEIFTGRTPFSGDDPTVVIQMHQKTPVPDPRIVFPDIPEGIVSLILKCCAPKKADRYDSMHAVLEDLKAVCGAIKEEMTGTASI